MTHSSLFVALKILWWGFWIAMVVGFSLYARRRREQRALEDTDPGHRRAHARR